MDIGKVNNELPEYQPEKKFVAKKADELPPPVEDKVDLSLEARRRLAEMADQALGVNETIGADRAKTETDSTTKAESLDEVRQRIKSGFYEQEAVKRKIADKLADDLDKQQ